MRRIVIGILLVVLVGWGQSALVAVDLTEFALITRFGAPVETLDGRTDAGLHLKWPWPIDTTARLDRRMQTVDLPAIEALTRDAVGGAVDKTLAVDVYFTWRIPDAAAAEQFYRTLGTAEQVRRVLGPQIAGRVAAAVSTVPFETLIAVAAPEPAAARAASFRARITENLAPAVRADYGIELVDFRVRRFRYPDAVRASLADRIRSERARKVAEYEAEGRLKAAQIAATADQEARAIEAAAAAEKTRVEGQADADADAIRAQAFARDPEFYEFLEKLASYRAMLANTRDFLLLSTRHPLFDLLTGPPPPERPAP